MSELRSTTLDYRKRICDAMNYIAANLKRDPSLEEIAGAAALSKFHFHRIFGMLTGETVAAFTRRLRLEAAANSLLADPDASVTGVALDFGFSSSQNFAKAFRKAFGESPSEFRLRKGGTKDRKAGNAEGLLAGYDSVQEADTTQLSARSTTVKAKIQDLPAYHVAYVRKLGPYGKETCGAAFGELGRWAGPKGLFGRETMLGVYWDNPDVTPPEKCRVDACITVPADMEPESPIAVQDLRGGAYAVCRFEMSGESFQEAWNEAFAWLMKEGHECDDAPCFEVYHNDGTQDPNGVWIFDICIPVKR